MKVKAIYSKNFVLTIDAPVSILITCSMTIFRQLYIPCILLLTSNKFLSQFLQFWVTLLKSEYWRRVGTLERVLALAATSANAAADDVAHSQTCKMSHILLE